MPKNGLGKLQSKDSVLARRSILFSHVIRYVGQTSILAAYLFFGNAQKLGILAYSLAVSATIFTFFSLGLRTQILSSSNPPGLKLTLKIRSISLVLATALSLGFLLPTLPAETWLIPVGVVTLKVSDWIVDWITAWLQVGAKFKKMSLISVTIALATTLIGAITSALHQQTLAPALAGTVSLVIAIYFSLQTLFKHRGTEMKLSNAVGMVLRNGITLGFSYACVSLFVSIPQTILSWNSQHAESGKLSFVTYAVVAAELVANPMSQSWLSKLRAERKLHMGAVLARRITLELTLASLPATLVVFSVIFGTASAVNQAYFPGWDSMVITLICMLCMPAVHVGLAGQATQERYSASFFASTVPVLLSILFVAAKGFNLSFEEAVQTFAVATVSRALIAISYRPRRQKLTAVIPGSHITIIGSANGMDNLGDDAMWIGTLKAVREASPGKSFVSDLQGLSSSKYPSDVEFHPALLFSLKRGGLLHISEYSLVRFIAKVVSAPFAERFALRRFSSALAGKKLGRLQNIWKNTIQGSDALVFSGAGAINDRYYVNGVLSWAVMSKWASDSGVPIHFLGHGLGPLSGWRENVAAEMLRTAETVVVRDQESLDLAFKLGVHQAEFLPDFSTLLEPTDEERRLADELYKRMGAPSISLTIHGIRQSGLSGNQENCVRELAAWAYQSGEKILTLPNMYGVGLANDYLHMKKLISKVQKLHKNVFAVASEELSPGVTRALLGRVKLAITSRYHTAVFAGSERTPTLALVVDPYWGQKLKGAQINAGQVPQLASFEDTSKILLTASLAVNDDARLEAMKDQASAIRKLIQRISL